MILWLASGSPRRKQLLESAGYPLEIHPPQVDESEVPGLSPIEFAQHLAAKKVATAPLTRLALAADTLVHVDAQLLHKPIDHQQACEHLRILSGRWHQVTTGVSVRSAHGQETFAVTTPVRFRALSDAEITRYVSSGEPMDKAGGYGIQGLGAVLVAEVQGSWTNVMGLPMEATLDALRRLHP